MLKATCDELGFDQKVRQPTRNDNLLDLVLTDIQRVQTQTAPPISDHNLVIAKINLKVPERERFSSEVWQFRNADWESLCNKLWETNWDYFNDLDPHLAATSLNNAILDAADECIPKRILQETKSTHPWLNDKIEQLVDEKRKAQGTPQEREASEACSAGILQEHQAYARKCAEDLRSLKPGNKSWWAKARQSKDLKPKLSSIPALNDEEGQWIMDSIDKANLIGKTFAKKYALIEAQNNNYNELTNDARMQCAPQVPTEDAAKKTLENLRADSATGPDALPTRILRECAAPLAKPFRALALLIFRYKTWPSSWMLHWIVPLYKKGTVYQANNYRGVHLTPQISKAMERFLSLTMLDFIAAPICFGPNQFAYQKGKGARDALAFMILTWVDGFNRGNKYSVYCSDVSGAFDRVHRERLL